MTDTVVSPLTPAAARRAARNAGALAIAQIISKGALFIWQLVLIRLLGPFEYGIYGTVGALVQIGVVIAGFGIGNIVIREVARRREQAGEYLGAALFLQTLLALVAYVGVTALAAASGYDAEVRGFLALAGLSLFVDTLGNLSYDQLQAQERMVVTAAVEVGHILVRIALVAVALYAGYGLLGVYAMTLLTGIGRVVVLWGAVVRGGVRPHFPIDRVVARRLLTDGAPLALTALVSTAYTQADKLVTASWIGSEAVGYLTAAFTINYGMIELLSTTILIAIYPLMSRVSAHEDDRPLFRLLVGKLAYFSLIITLPITLTISLFSDTLTLIFGADFLPTAGVLRIIVWYTLIVMVSNVYSQALLVQNRQRYTFLIRALGLGINLVLLVLLLPRLGITGAPIASVSAELIVMSALVWAFGRSDAGRAPHESSRSGVLRLARVFVAGALAALAMVVLGQVHFVLGIAGGLTVYVGAALALRVLAGDDWALLRRLVEAMPGGQRVARWLPKGS